MSRTGPAIDLTEEVAIRGPVHRARRALLDIGPPGADEAPDESYRALVLHAMLVVGCAIALLVGAGRLVDEGLGSGFWGAMAGAAGIAVALGVMRAGLVSRPAMGDAFVLFGILSTGVVAALDGGLMSHGIVWFGAIPLIGQLVGGRLRALQSAALCSIWLLGMFGLQRADLLPVPSTELQPGATALFAAVGSTLYMAVCAWVFERAHRRAEQERERLAQVQRDWIAVVSHELRTPLTALRGSIDLLASGKVGTLPDDGERLLRMAKANSDRLVRLVDDVLDLRRLETGRLTLNPSRTDLAVLIEEAVARHRPVAEGRGVQIQIDAGHLHLFIDPDRIIQVFDNLLSNAIKHAPPDTSVSVVCRHAGGTIQVMVNDHGSGVPADFVPLLFTPFAQANAGPMPSGKGSGLGLTICRALIQLHGGTIHYEPRASGGARFVIRLPESLLQDTTDGD